MTIDVQSQPSTPTLQFKPHDPPIELRNPSPNLLQAQSQSYLPLVRKWEPPVSAWMALCHPRVDEVSREVDGYFLKHWKFPNAKAEMTFLKAGFSRVTSLYFPMAKPDRIHFACRLLTVLFLIDGNTHFPLVEFSSPSKRLERERSNAQKDRK